jgi:hypothetical protein
MQSRASFVFLLAVLFASVEVLGCSGTPRMRNLTVSGALPTTGTVGVAYTASLTVSGGTAPYTWTIAGLPAGLMANGTTTTNLTVSGTPTAAGTSSVSISVADAKGENASSTVSIVISSTAVLTVTTTALPAATINVPYSTSLAAENGTPPYTWTETSGGPLPAGLNLSPSGVISGTPTALGTSGPYVFTVTDSAAAMAPSPGLTLTVNPAGAVTACGPSPTPRGNEGLLKSPYAFIVQGSDVNDLPVAFGGSFTPDGTGKITASDVDVTSYANGPQSLAVSLSSSAYSFGADGRGCLYLTFSGLNDAVRNTKKTGTPNPNFKHGRATKRAKPRNAHANLHPMVSTVLTNVVFSFALGSDHASNQTGRITEFDDTQGEGVVSAGRIYAQTKSDFVLANLAGNFAFGVEGWLTVDVDLFDRAAIAGSFTNTAGTISNLAADDDIGGTASGELEGGSGSLGSAVSNTTGRGTGSYTIHSDSGDLTFDFAYYVVNGSDIFLVSTDDPNPDGSVLLSGRALATSSVSGGDLNGFYLFALNGIDVDAADDGANFVEISNFQATAAGSLAGFKDYSNDAGLFTAAPATTGTWSVDESAARIEFDEVTANPPVAYLASGGADDQIVGFLVGTDPFSTAGIMILQSTSTPAFTTADITATYAFGSEEDVTGLNSSIVGAFTSDGEGNYTTVADVVTVDEGTTPNATSLGTLAVNADGSGTLNSGGVAFVTNGSQIFGIDGNVSSQPLLYIFIQQAAPSPAIRAMRSKH